AIQFARDLGFRSVEIEGDSALVLGFEHFKFQHIKRGGNRVAHRLAREGFLRKRDVCWIEDGPTLIQAKLLKKARSDSFPLIR
ncbi:hypothetical protein Golax_005729, partial [Gossypium laxum]|nr:hypothetical protein [Gossypium laxum]